MSARPSSVAVTLTWAEVLQAALCGVMRNLAAMKAGRMITHGTDANDMWACHIEGAGGEMAFAKAFGKYWGAGVNTFRAPDVGTIQVRTRTRHEYDLIVRKQDAEDEVYVLVTGRAPQYQIHGWMLGGEAKQERFLQTYKEMEPAYFVPQGELRILAELIT